MPAWPSNGSENWNDAMSAFIDLEHDKATGKHRAVCAARMYLTANQSNITDATVVKVLLNADTYDPDGITDTTTSLITPNKAGYYYVHGSIRYTGLIVNKDYLCYLHKNDTAFSTNIVQCSAVTSINGLTVSGSGIVQMNGVSDTLSLNAYVNVGVNTVDIRGLSAGDTFLSCFFLGA